MIYKYPQLESDETLKKNLVKIQKIIVEKNKSAENLKAKSKTLKKIEHFIKAVFRSFFKLILIFLLNNRKDVTYVAFAVHGGLGDMLRERSVITDVIKMCPNVIIDIYNRKAKQVLKDIKNIRFFLDADLIELTKSRYDISYMMVRDVTDILFIRKGKHTPEKIISNISIYKGKYKNNVHLINMLKCGAGSDNVEDISLSISYKKLSLEKFGFTKDMKYITFQHGVGDRGDDKDLRCWDSKYWEKLLLILKKWFKDIKIVQVGMSSYEFKEADINVAKKTSLDELCSVLKDSLLHIDTDGACTHIARALGTKSIVLFGPTPIEYIGYPENINIVSSFCSGCHYIGNRWGKCLLGHDKSLCMDSIPPEFVAEKAVEYLKSLE